MTCSLHSLNADDRPRERLVALGARRLSQAELLAIVLGSGSHDESAVELARHLLSDCHQSLRTLGRMSVAQLQTYKGIGLAKAVAVVAACELGRRHAAEEPQARNHIESSADIAAYFAHILEDLPHEECHVLFLDQRLRVIKSIMLSQGGLTGTVVDVRLALREALLCNATRMALCHNHPSGTPEPSSNDNDLTKRMATAARAVQVELIDHVIVYHGGFYSYADHCKL